MSADAIGPLFAWPPAATVSWLKVLPAIVAGGALVILVSGMWRGRLEPAAGVAGMLLLPIAAYGLGVLAILEHSKDVHFCGSCHVMGPIVASLEANDDSLASLHYARGAVPHGEACYTCHSGYGIWGTVDAKRAGFLHMWHTVTGDYELPTKLRGSFNINSCLNCHAGAARFRNVAAHQDIELQRALLSREIGCTGMCHPGPHPETALQEQRPAS